MGGGGPTGEGPFPGRGVARLASWLLEPADLERAVEPALADLHFEWAAVRAGGGERAAARLAAAGLARIVFLLVPALVVARRGRRLVEARWAPLAPALGAVAFGTWAFRDVAPSPSYVTMQLAFVGAGLGLALLAGTTSAAGWRRFGPAWGLLALASLGAALAGEGSGGARRWASIGPLRLQTSLLVWPLFVVALASLAERRRHRSAVGLLAASLGLLAAQRDPATALPWAVSAYATLRAAGAPAAARRAAVAAAALGVGLSLARAVALEPLPHVEGVWGLLARRGAAAAGPAIACAAAVVVAPFLTSFRAHDRFARAAALGLGALLAGLFARPLLAAEPIPLLGYGGSGAVGVLLGLGLVAGLAGEGRAARPG